MKRILPIIIAILLVFGCGTPRRTTIIEHKTETHYIDSTRWHDSTIYYTIPIERYRDYASLLDTLRLETSLAKSEAYIDTTNNTIKGSIENKGDSLKTVIKWKEHIVYRDSIEYKEVPVEVVKEVTKYPKSYWWLLGATILTVLYFAFKIYLKIKFGKSI